MNFKKILLIILALFIIIGIFTILIFGENTHKKSENEKIQIISSNFASYDFLRAIIGDVPNINLTFLIGPGKDAHSYDPTAQDIIKLQNSDLFVYIGGEMENWSEKIIPTLNKNQTELICISDFVSTIEEKDIDGAEKEENHEERNEEHKNNAFDEHIWTSPKNAIDMINILEKNMEKIDPDHSNIYKENAANYINKIKNVDNKIQEIVNNKVRDRLVFADRMPMQYFIDYYNLKVTAAFNGCSTDTEPSPKTITYLENKIKEEHIPVILYIELNPGTIATTIANELGNNCETMQIQSLHNISLKDFNNGETWVSLMTKNIEVLKKALL